MAHYRRENSAMPLYISILSNFRMASRGFSATARLSCSDRSNAEITHSTLIFTAVT